MDFQNNKLDKESSDGDDDVLNKGSLSEKQRRKRRSKNEAEGRNFECTDCGKCYLSLPALTNHRKTKHGYGQGEDKKGRGRPRKNVSL